MPRAVIIGGSLGGLFAAHLLRSTGWEACVFERNPEDLTGRGAGLSTHPQLIEILHRIGIDFDESMGTKISTILCLNRSGQAYLKTPTARTMSSWGRLYRSLRDALPSECYSLGRSFQWFEQDDTSVTAVFADGSRARGDLLVAADGGRSSVREQFLPGLQAEYAGYVAWRAMLDEAQVPPAIRAEIFEHYTFCLPEGELCLAYPVPGRNNETQVGHRAYNIVWYRPADPERVLPDLCTDAQGRCHGTTIAPPLIRPDVIAGINASAHSLLAPQIAEIFARTPQPFFQPILELTPPNMVFGRVALLGDAAFVARPHVGAGVTKAALDAASLADALAGGDITAGLRRYEREQQPFGRGLVALGRQEEGAYLNAQIKARNDHSTSARAWNLEELLQFHHLRSERLAAVLAQSRQSL
jgi:2-polyprenyl-6-methoxyphenol hydroxylase-like FAD-dependent oxidoreductase